MNQTLLNVSFVLPTDASNASSGFLILAAACVFIMTPGLGLFYAGMARRKNSLTLLMLSFICMVVVGFQWYFLIITIACAVDACFDQKVHLGLFALLLAVRNSVHWVLRLHGFSRSRHLLGVLDQSVGQLNCVCALSNAVCSCDSSYHFWGCSRASSSVAVCDLHLLLGNDCVRRFRVLDMGSSRLDSKSCLPQLGK
jgi:hypothetical protein